MEIVVVSLVFLLLSQWMWGSSSKPVQSPEPTPLITAPEPQPNGEKVRLLLDEQPESLPVAPVAEQEAIAPNPPLESPVTLEAASINVVALEAMNSDEAVDTIPSSGFIAELTELTQPAALPQNTSRPASRRDEVWALLDQAAGEGVEGYNALLAYVKDKSSQGTSRSTIKAWKEARARAVVCG